MAEENQQGIKVTDRRMFTDTGELREGFEPEENESPEPEVAAEREAAPEPISRPEPVAASAREPQAQPVADPQVPPAGPRDAPEGYSAGPRQPQFLDLVAMLAEPVALFLGDATMPGQEPMEDLDRARMHIDLLGLLEGKCQGNLDEQESAILGDLVYRLRLRYVEKKG